jgi:hypothetical protein
MTTEQRKRRLENARAVLSYFEAILPPGAESRVWWAAEVAKREPGAMTARARRITEAEALITLWAIVGLSAVSMLKASS